MVEIGSKIKVRVEFKVMARFWLRAKVRVRFSIEVKLWLLVVKVGLKSGLD